jgi:hypothetical protein
MPGRPPARFRDRWLGVLFAVTLLGGWATSGISGARPASAVASAAMAAPAADPGTESQFVTAINDLRASRGLRQLQVSGELTGVARAWTDHMVGNGGISHNPSIASQVSGSWKKLGENVGVGYDVDGLMQAFIDSPSHLRNLVDPDWNWIGVGVSWGSDGRLYTTHNFMQRDGGGAPPPAPAPSPPPTTAPPTTAPPPPPTTTTTVPPPPPPPEPEPSQARVNAVLEPLRSLEAD